MLIITNQEMRKALSTVLDLAKQGVLREMNEPMLKAERNKQLHAIKLVEHLLTTLFMHNLTRGRDDKLEG